MCRFLHVARRLCVTTTIFAVALLTRDLKAASLIWTNGSGLFNSSTNWNTSLSTTYTNGDSSVFTNDTSYTVTFTNGSRYIGNSNVFNGHAGAVTLDLTGSTWTLTNSASGANASATAAFVVGQSQDTTATVYLAGGTLAITNTGNNANLVVGGLGRGTFFVTNGMVIMNQTKIGAGTAGSGSGTLVFSGSGTTFSNSSTFFVGNGSANNTLVMSNSASGTIVSAFTIGNAGFGGNSLLLTNATLFSNAGTIGAGSSNNIASVLTDATWQTLGAVTITVGGGAAVGNVLVVNGGILTNVQNFNIGTLSAASSAANFGNSLTVSNGGTIYSAANGNTVIGANRSSNNVFNAGGLGALSTITIGNLHIGAASSGNTLTITNASFTLDSAAIRFGENGGSNNVMTVLTNGTLSVIGSTATWTIGNGPGTGNQMIVNGGTVSLNGAGTIGNGSGDVTSGNSLTISNGGLFVGRAITVGFGGSSNNVYNVGGLGAVSSASNVTSAAGTIGSIIIVGAAGSGFNTLTVTNATYNSGALTVGSGSSNNTTSVLSDGTYSLMNRAITIGSGAAVGNTLTVNGGAVSNITILTVGSGGTALGNRLTVTNGGQVYAAMVQAGTAFGGDNNSVLISAGGLLEANTLSNFFGGSGNTISNVGGIYQFTIASPTNAPNVAGGIALTDGTISFRAITNADVTNNLGNGALSGITFAGNNTFMLNGASNTTAGQTYTFGAAQPNGPSNYVNLVLVNGQTAYRGGEITIEAGASFMASNTVATITGSLTNNGMAAIVDSTVNFQNVLQVAGTLTLRNGFVTGSAAKTVTGLLRGNGSVVGDMTVSNIAPGFSVGTLVFSNSLTLAGTYAAELDGTGAGTNDLLVVKQTLTLTGSTLNLSELAPADDAAYIVATYGTLVGTFGTVNGLPGGYTLEYSYNSGNQIAVVLVPEPGGLFLVLIGLGMLLAIRRTRP